MKKKKLFFLLCCFLGMNFIYPDAESDMTSAIKKTLIDSFLNKIDSLKIELDVNILKSIQTQFTTPTNILDTDQTTKLNKIISDKETSGVQTGTGSIDDQIKKIRDQISGYATQLANLGKEKDEINVKLSSCNLSLSDYSEKVLLYNLNELKTAATITLNNITTLIDPASISITDNIRNKVIEVIQAQLSKLSVADLTSLKDNTKLAFTDAQKTIINNLIQQKQTPATNEQPSPETILLNSLDALKTAATITLNSITTLIDPASISITDNIRNKVIEVIQAQLSKLSVADLTSLKDKAKVAFTDAQKTIITNLIQQKQVPTTQVDTTLLNNLKTQVADLLNNTKWDDLNKKVDDIITAKNNLISLESRTKTLEDKLK